MEPSTQGKVLSRGLLFSRDEPTTPRSRSWENRVGRSLLAATIPGTGLRLHGVWRVVTSHPSPHQGLGPSLSALFQSPRLELSGHFPEGAPRASTQDVSCSSQDRAGLEGRRSLSRKATPSPRLCVLFQSTETDPAQEPQGSLGGSSLASARAPQPPATHLMWKFWMLTFL